MNQRSAAEVLCAARRVWQKAPHMMLRVGRPTLIGDFARYTRHFDLLEVRTDAGKVPRPKRLRTLRESAPPGFVFSVVLPTALAQLDLDLAERDRALAVAEALQTDLLVLSTPASVRPGRRTLERLAAVVDTFAGHRLVWEPTGLFDQHTAARAARDVGVSLVRDLSREAIGPGDVVYTRVKSLGRGGRVSASVVDRLVDKLDGQDAAYVIIDGNGAIGVARELRTMLGAEEEES
ncbi:MAG: DUF72 domain-containing protein [Polyangiaceae bacterium]